MGKFELLNRKMDRSIFLAKQKWRDHSGYLKHITLEQPAKTEWNLCSQNASEDARTMTQRGIVHQESHFNTSN
jgi:hypothetical protein